MSLIDELIIFLASNLILTQALGTSTLFIAAGSRKNLLWTAITITVFTTSASAAAYFINSFLPKNSEDFSLVLYVIAIGVIYMILLALLYLTGRKKFRIARKYVHLSAFNCAVMGTVLTVTEKAAENPHLNNIGSFVFAGAEAGAGFILASFILMAAYRKLTSANVPVSFRGFPAMLLYLGIISMAVYSLS